MRYPKEHLAETRRKLLAEGGSLFKLRGIQGAGVDGVARAVGLSGAALYSHFASKKEFLCEVLREELAATAKMFLEASGTWQDALAGYLSLAHVQAPAAGCVLPGVTADVARSDEDVRQAFQAGISDITRALDGLTGRPGLSLGVLAAAVGAVTLARAMPGKDGARMVLRSTRELITIALNAEGAKESSTPRPKPKADRRR
jgi:AcrR family transcriptional regulator